MRYVYLRAPFGISNVSEIYNRTMTQNLAGLPNHKKIADDNIVYSKSREEHVTHVKALLDRWRAKNIRLYPDKFVYMQKTVKFAGLLFYEYGYRIADHILDGISNFPAPKNKSDLRSFNGLANQLAPTHRDLAKALAPLRPLLKADVDWTFDADHLAAFNKPKKILTSPSVIAY